MGDRRLRRSTLAALALAVTAALAAAPSGFASAGGRSDHGRGGIRLAGAGPISLRMHCDDDAVADLTPRECEVLSLMAEGRSNQGIAARLVVTDHAVEKHIRSIFKELRIESGPEDHRRVLAVLTFLNSPSVQR